MSTRPLPSGGLSLRLAALGLSAVVAACGDAAPRRPNVIFISIDSLRADHVGAYGYAKPTSANLDRLAAGGARVEPVVAETSWTLPTHATMLTGLAQLAHGLGAGGRLSEHVVTMPELFQAAGYRTHALWSGPYLHPYFGLDQGFAPGDYQSILELQAAAESSFDPTDPTGKAVIGKLHRKSYTARTSAEIVDRSIRFLDATRDTPFFLFLHLFDVHYDYDPPEEFWRPFDPDYAGTLDASNWMANESISRDMSAEDLAHVIALYDGEIAYVDRQLGRLFAALDERGLARDTIVVVTSDHGDEFFEHGRKGHRNSLFDEVLLVPWIVRWPGVVPANTVIDAQARHVDLMPTVLELAGLSEPYALQGVSFAAAMRGEAPAVAQPAASRLLLASEEIGVWESLRLERTKYVRMQARGRTFEALYDLVRDPGERNFDEGGSDDAQKAQARQRLDALRDAELRLQQQLQSSGTTAGALPPELEDELRQLGYIK